MKNFKEKMRHKMLIIDSIGYENELSDTILYLFDHGDLGIHLFYVKIKWIIKR